MSKITNQMLDSLSDSLPTLQASRKISPRSIQDPKWIKQAIVQRGDALAASVRKTVQACPDLEAIARLFLTWMQDGTIVRVLGAGRARLAAAIPANRLAHGGARVFVQDDIIPMPHTVNGGGVIAASASGRTRSVLDILDVIRKEAPHITIVGIAKADADEFKGLCHHFIGIEEDTGKPNPLRALADVGEYVISEVLDALVVAAGRLGGFDDRRWRLGHENIGPSGPYDAIEAVDLLFTEVY